MFHEHLYMTIKMMVFVLEVVAFSAGPYFDFASKQIRPISRSWITSTSSHSSPSDPGVTRYWTFKREAGYLLNNEHLQYEVAYLLNIGHSQYKVGYLLHIGHSKLDQC